MPKRHRHAILSFDDLEPTFTTPQHDYASQVASMRELRALSNEVADAYHQRDRRMQALALSGSLSREDMARATGLAKSRVDQIIRELTELDAQRRSNEAQQRLSCHLA